MYKLFLIPLVLLASLEAVVLVYFGVKCECVKRAEDEDDWVDADQAKLQALKKNANRRWYFAVLIIFLTTFSSVIIGVTVLGTDFRQAPGDVARRDLIIIIVIGALRTLVALLVVGGLLFGINPEGCNGIYLAAWIFAPITLVLPAISGCLFAKSFSIFRDVDIPDGEKGTPEIETKGKASQSSGEKQGLLKADCVRQMEMA